MKEFFLRNIIGIVGVVLMLCLGSVMWLTPKIELLGETRIVVPVNEEYIDAGARASLLEKDISQQIVSESDVDVSKIGTYKTTYTIVNIVFKAKVVRVVEVVDHELPVINIIGDSEIKLCPHKDYVEPGYTAMDNYDGDITNRVKSTVSDNMVLYEVTDSSGNYTSATRKINRDDKEPPVITLNGASTIYLVVGSKYSEPGFTATDAFDDEINSKVQVKGTVNTNAAGTYVLTYEATDCSGNSASVTRKIVVSNPAPPSQPSGGNGVSGSTIYLTFDDGPSYLTPQILDILRDEGVKATFFVLGSRQDNAIWNRIVNEGHTIALHSDTHIYSQVYSSVTAYFNDLYAVRDKVRNVTGVDSKIIRFPGGSSNTVSRNYCPGIMTVLVQEVQNRGFHYFDWNVSSGDTGNITSNQVYINVTTGLKNKTTCVVLMHDYGGNEKTRDALRDIIRYGKSHGYKFDRITMSTPQIHHTVAN